MAEVLYTRPLFYNELPNIDEGLLTEEYIEGHFSSAGILFVNRRGDVLLGSHLFEIDGVEFECWGPYAGKKKVGESSWEAASRECREESGIVPSEDMVVGRRNILIPRGERGYVPGVIYICNLSEDIDTYGLKESVEVSSHRWFSKEEVFRLIYLYPYLLWDDVYTNLLLRSLQDGNFNTDFTIVCTDDMYQVMSAKRDLGKAPLLKNRSEVHFNNTVFGMVRGR